MALQLLPRLIQQGAQAFGLPPAALTNGTRARPVVQARAAAGAVAMLLCGLPATRVAAALGVTQMPVVCGIPSGRDLLRAVASILRGWRGRCWANAVLLQGHGNDTWGRDGRSRQWVWGRTDRYVRCYGSRCP